MPCRFRSGRAFGEGVQRHRVRAGREGLTYCSKLVWQA